VMPLSLLKFLVFSLISIASLIYPVALSNAEHPKDEDRDGLQNIGFFAVQPLDPADSPRMHLTACPSCGIE
jgi:hypothetical protein